MKNTQFVKIFAVLLLVIAAIVSCNRESLLEDQPAPEANSSKLITYNSQGIPGQYIVVMNEDHLSAGLRSATTYEQRQQLMREDGQRLLDKHRIGTDKIQRVYGTALKGMCLSGLSEQEVQNLIADPAVKYLEQDQLVQLQGGPPTKPIASCASNESNEDVVPCGVELVNGGADYNGGHKAYILDTGIDLDHPDLNVADYGFNAVLTKPKDLTLDDGNGHGTHVAGIIAAENNGIGVIGVAAGALVVPVKVLSYKGSGSYSGIIAGVDWVAGDADPGDVANMSLGGGIDYALNEAVLTASNNGIWFTLAAGNESSHAGLFSPSSTNGDYVRTIAAMDCNSVWAYYSNYGMPPVDYIAPGTAICSTYKDGGYTSMSGTSMAAPHAAGVLLATNGNPNACGTVTFNGQDYPIICK